MSESPQNDVSDLWSIYQSLKTQLESVIAQKSDLVTLLANLPTAGAGVPLDVSSVNSGGEQGSESYTIQTLTDKIEQLSRVESSLRKTMEEQRKLAISAEAGFVVSKIGGGRRRWW